jgi:hypothetical protein
LEAVGVSHNNDFDNRCVQAFAISNCGIAFALRLSADFLEHLTACRINEWVLQAKFCTAAYTQGLPQQLREIHNGTPNYSHI